MLWVARERPAARSKPEAQLTSVVIAGAAFSALGGLQGGKVCDAENTAQQTALPRDGLRATALPVGAWGRNGGAWRACVFGALQWRRKGAEGGEKAGGLRIEQSGEGVGTRCTVGCGLFSTLGDSAAAPARALRRRFSDEMLQGVMGGAVPLLLRSGLGGKSWGRRPRGTLLCLGSIAAQARLRQRSGVVLIVTAVQREDSLRQSP